MHHLLTALSIASLAAAQSPIAGIWPLDETAGLTTADIGPFGNHGTLVGFTNDPAQWVSGKIGNGLAFDGIDDYVDIAFNGGLPFYDGLGAAFSVCFWVNGAPADDDRVLSLSSTVSNTPLFTLGCGYNSAALGDRLRLYLRDDNGVSAARHSQAAVFDGTWHHVAYTEHAGEARVYVDGVLDVAGFSTEPYDGSFTLDRLTLGAVVRSSLCCALAFTLDDLHIYSFPLAAADVATVMTGAPVTTCRASFAEYGTGCGAGPLDLAVAGSPVLGGPGLIYTLRGGPAGGNGLLLLGAGKPAPFDLGLVGIAGCRLYPSSPSVVGSSPLNAFGSVSAPMFLPVPNIPSLACVTITTQAAGVGGGAIVTSDAVLVLLGT